jgi:glutathione S-transferase
MKPRPYNTQGCPYARRTRIVLHEKQIDFDVHEVDLSNKSEEFLNVSPYEKIPVLAVNGKPKIPTKQRIRRSITS